MTEPVSRRPAVRRDELETELHLLIEALDRRLPQLDRLGEAEIVGEAAELRRRAVAQIARIKDGQSNVGSND